MKLVSRVVTVYGQWDYLALWLGNDQLFVPEVEWILVNDDPSRNCSIELLTRLKQRGITCLSPEINQGRSGARNLGLAASTSPWVEFVDGDDIPLPLELDDFQSLPDADIILFRNDFYRIGKEGVEVSPEEAAADDVWQRIGLLRELPPINCRPACLVFRREILNRVHGFDGRFDTCEDLHLVWKMDQVGATVKSIAKVKQLYRRDDQASCNSEVVDWSFHRLMRMAAGESDRVGGDSEEMWRSSARHASATALGLIAVLEVQAAKDLVEADVGRKLLHSAGRLRRINGNTNRISLFKDALRGVIGR